VAWIHVPVCKNARESLFLRSALSFCLIAFGSDHVWLNSGIVRDSVADDPQLGGKRNELINLAAQKLTETNMITFESQRGRFHITDLGRIAAKYYIRYSSMKIFAEEFRPKMSEADVLAMLCKSTEARSFSSCGHAPLTLIVSLIKSKYVSRRMKNLNIS
jgi:replicative superfamily II helicase